jgi:hypothetical protein
MEIQKILRGFWLPPMEDNHTTTNKKQAATMEGSMEGMCTGQEVQEKHDAIVLGGGKVKGW